MKSTGSSDSQFHAPTEMQFAGVRGGECQLPLYDGCIIFASAHTSMDSMPYNQQQARQNCCCQNRPAALISRQSHANIKCALEVGAGTTCEHKPAHCRLPNAAVPAPHCSGCLSAAHRCSDHPAACPTLPTSPCPAAPLGHCLAPAGPGGRGCPAGCPAAPAVPGSLAAQGECLDCAGATDNIQHRHRCLLYGIKHAVQTCC